MRTEKKMNGALDIDAVLACLRTLPRATTWQERLSWARSLETEFRDSRPSEPAAELVYLLADDPKWEVRKTVADLLCYVPERDWVTLSDKLTEDSNAFVRNAVVQALRRRKQDRRQARQAESDFNSVLARLARIERQYGKEAAVEARQVADQLYELMIGAIAHDMRGVLTRLNGRTAALQRHVDGALYDPAVFRKALHTIAGRLAFIERLVDDMQAYGRQVKIRCRRERLSELISEVCSMAREHVRSLGHNPDRVLLTVRVPTAATLDASRHVILTALANVLNNAYDALLLPPGRSEGAKIELSARVVGSWVKILIRDNGLGMEKEHLREVREFLPGQTTKKGIGTGFGLPIARRNIEAHNGEIDIDSRDNEGTSVTITLPRDHRSPRQATEKERPHAAEGTRS
ncbi:MAG: HAMP domain-containing histidine kinase [Candidatus Nealsonbacteria bacterium]|nr:HAMP domain-containing histidine kinase [Candidatus Nealsonbacteria bacterium]